MDKSDATKYFLQLKKINWDLAMIKHGTHGEEIQPHIKLMMQEADKILKILTEKIEN